MKEQGPPRHRVVPLILPLLWGGVLWLGGCGPFDTRPYTPDPNRIRVIEPLELPASPPDAAEPADPTRPPDRAEPAPPAPEPAEREVTLTDLREIALRNNLELRVSRLDPQIAGERLSEEEAFFEASLVANASYSNIDSPTPVATVGSQIESWRVAPGLVVPLRTGGIIEGRVSWDRTETNNPFAVLDPAYQTQTRLTLTQPLARGFGADATEFRIRVAAAQLGQAQARRKLEVIRTLADVDRGYWLLYAANQALEVRQQQLLLTTQQLDRARRLFEAGTHPEVEVLRAQSSQADAEELLLQAQNLLRQRQRMLKRMINDPELRVGGSTRLVPGTLPAPVIHAIDAEALVSSAMDRRMDLLEAELRIAEQAATILFARNARLPRVGLQYQYNVNGLGPSTGDAFDMMTDFDFQDHIVGLDVEVPLGNRAARSRLRQAMLRRTQELAFHEARQQLIRQEVHDAADRLETAWQRILAARRRVQLAARLYQAEVNQFDLGLITGTDLLEAQTNLAAAQLAEIEALTEYEVSRVDLAFATGTVIGQSRIVIEE